MANARQHLAPIHAAEARHIVVLDRGRADAIIGTAQRNARHRNRRLQRQCLLDGFQRRVAGGVQEAMAIGMNDHLDKIRVIKRRRGLGVEARPCGPGRRPQRPQQLAQPAAIGGQTVHATLGVKVELIPQAVLCVGRTRLE
ncbi:hypothetical protein AO063_13595 [Pseudomonas fluorescens ICMP 11288]|uniref:Uncharacterized protein n=1 Tax=Pseudomonas fluorescens ICMP 11288 TaxID=1198309 RepID=A0A0W0HRD1_PSEFL|nr:hypothetical protein AO063_13595 [Pseudomonas fluorescens ICMP 11288]